MGLLHTDPDCRDCRAEVVCAELRASLAVESIDYSIAPESITVLLPDLTPLIVRYCPHCGRRLHLWHSEGHWHMSERDPRRPEVDPCD